MVEDVTEVDVVEEAEADAEAPKPSEAEAKEAATKENDEFYAEDDVETDGLLLAERSKVDGTKHF